MSTVGGCAVLGAAVLPAHPPAVRLALVPKAHDHPFYEAISKPELGFKTYTWPSSISPLITPAKLKLERKTLEYDFNSEYNAAFIDDEFSYLPSNLVLSCTDDYELNGEPRPGDRLRGE